MNEVNKRSYVGNIVLQLVQDTSSAVFLPTHSLLVLRNKCTPLWRTNIFQLLSL